MLNPSSLRAVAGALLVACVSAPSLAAAVTVTVDGTRYDITEQSGTFPEQQALIESQIWWRDSDLALDFAEAVGPDLFDPDRGFGTPFYYMLRARGTQPLNRFTSVDTLDRIIGIDNVSIVSFATAELSAAASVPLPAGLPLLLAGPAFMRRRAQQI